jgi:hypothetical protein
MQNLQALGILHKILQVHSPLCKHVNSLQIGKRENSPWAGYGPISSSPAQTSRVERGKGQTSPLLVRRRWLGRWALAHYQTTSGSTADVPDSSRAHRSSGSRLSFFVCTVRSTFLGFPDPYFGAVAAFHCRALTKWRRTPPTLLLRCK